MNAFVKTTYRFVTLFVLLMFSGCALWIGERGKEFQMVPAPQYPPRYPPGSRWGYITVHSIPSGASLYLSNRYVGNTPIDELKIKSRVYDLEVIKNGYEPHVEVIWVVPSSEETKFHIILKKR